MKVITIGRDDGNDRVIIDPHASRYHLQIIQHDDGHFSLSDFGSTNGTYVNGQKISGEVLLKETDIVRIGNTTIPWRMYFDYGEHGMAPNIISIPQGNLSSDSSNEKKSKKENNSQKKGWLIVSCGITLLLGMGCLFMSILKGGIAFIMLPEVIFLIGGLAFVVLSIVLLIKILRKKSQ